MIKGLLAALILFPVNAYTQNLGAGVCAICPVGNVGDIVNGGQSGPVTIGTNDLTSLTYLTNNIAAISIDSNQNVGIGTGSPTSQLHIVGDGSSSDITIFANNDSFNSVLDVANDGSFSRGALEFSRSRGTLDARSALFANNNIGGILFKPGNSAANPAFNAASISATTGPGTQSTINISGNLLFNTREDGLGVAGSAPEKMRLAHNGALGLNDTSPDAQFEILSKSSDTGFVLAVSSQNDVTGNILSVLGNGNIGIGVSIPTYKFEVLGSGDADANMMNLSNDSIIRVDYDVASLSSTFSPILRLKRSRGTLTSRSALINDDRIGKIDFISGNNNGTPAFVGSYIESKAVGTQSNTNIAAYLGFGTRENGLGSQGNATEKMRLADDGALGLNDTSPDAQFEILSKSSDTGFVLAVSSQNDVTGNILSVLGNGNVGIGTTTPSLPLSVVGDGIFTGVVHASSFNVTGSAYLVEGVPVIHGDRTITLASATLNGDVNMKGNNLVNVGSISAGNLPIYILKTLDEEVTNNNTLQADNELTVSLEANSTYFLNARLSFNADSGTPNIKLGWEIPVNSTMSISHQFRGGGDGTFDGFILTQNLVASSSIGVQGTGVESGGNVIGTIVTANAGSLTLYWSQNSSNANATRMKALSWLKVTKF